MDPQRPSSPKELAEALASSATASQSIALGGAFTKNRMAGPASAANVTVSTRALRRVLAYEPQDLTISVEAGLPFAELTRVVGENEQMVPLDPPFFENATVGGVVAANTSGPRRRLFGTARDLIIGMTFATLEGKLVSSGGMVVKNVAGLDMAKLMVGSFGTLAAIAVVNFKLIPRPQRSRTFVSSFDTLDGAVKARDSVLHGVLQPSAVDLLNPAASELFSRSGFTLLLQVGGNSAVLGRYSRELGGWEALEGTEEGSLWQRVREFVPGFLEQHESGAVVRISSTASELAGIVGEMEAPVLARAGSGVAYGCFADSQAAIGWLQKGAEQGHKAVLEFRPASGAPPDEMWPLAGTDLAMMKKIKHLFDPNHLLNKGRLYGRL